VVNRRDRLAPHKWIDVYFAGRTKQEVLSAASMEGFTASRKTNAIHALNVFTVEEYENNRKTQKRWTKIGAAFPHKDGVGFNIELKAFPVDGRLVALPPDPNEDRSK
jgi:hypothetical protein